MSQFFALIEIALLTVGIALFFVIWLAVMVGLLFEGGLRGWDEFVVASAVWIVAMLFDCGLIALAWHVGPALARAFQR